MKKKKSYKKSDRKKRNVICFLLIGLFCAALILFCVYYYENSYLEASSENPWFEDVMYSALDDMTLQNNIQHILDRESYDENIAMKYIAVMSGTELPDIKKEHIIENADNLFIKKQEDEKCILVQKDYKTLLDECDNIKKMNKLDYLFLGLTNQEIEKQSKGFYISQNNPEFYNMSYGTSDIYNSGCGPIAVTMAINYLTEKETVTLGEAVSWANENNMYEQNSGTRWKMIYDFPACFSVKCKEFYVRNTEELEGLLSDGGVLITSMTDGHFTDNGHFIVITDISDGMATVLDSASIHRSLKKWDADLLFNESKKYFWKLYN